MPDLSSALPVLWGERAGAFWRWWRRELAAAVPQAIAVRRKPRPRADIYLGADGIEIERSRDGVGERLVEERVPEQLDAEGWAELAELVAGARARIVLAPPACHALTLTLPPAARGRLRAAAALQLAQSAPLRPELLAWNFEQLPAGKKEIRLRVAMARRSEIKRLQGLFEANGIAPPPVAVIEDGRTIELASGADGTTSPERRRTVRAAAIAAALVASVPFTTWAGASLLASIEERRVERLGAEVGPRLEAERRAAGSEQLRKALRPLFEHPSATETIESLALGMPESAFAVAAERQYDGTLLLETRTSDRAALETGLGGNPLLASLNPADTHSGPDGHTVVRFRSARR